MLIRISIRHIKVPAKCLAFYENGDGREKEENGRRNGTGNFHKSRKMQTLQNDCDEWNIFRVAAERNAITRPNGQKQSRRWLCKQVDCRIFRLDFHNCSRTVGWKDLRAFFRPIWIAVCWQRCHRSWILAKKAPSMAHIKRNLLKVKAILRCHIFVHYYNTVWPSCRPMMIVSIVSLWYKNNDPCYALADTCENARRFFCVV